MRRTHLAFEQRFGRLIKKLLKQLSRKKKSDTIFSYLKLLALPVLATSEKIIINIIMCISKIIIFVALNKMIDAIDFLLVIVYMPQNASKKIQFKFESKFNFTALKMINNYLHKMLHDTVQHL